MSDNQVPGGLPPVAGALLGAGPAARLLLINGDDLGMSPETNAATIAALRVGRLTSATLIVPATYAQAAAGDCAGLAIGIHLTLNSEWIADRWLPLTGAPSLTDGDGALCRLPHNTCARARAADVRSEWRAQIEQAIAWGIDPSHLDSHMYIAQQRPDFFDIYLDLATSYGLPVRVSGSINQPDHPFRARARERGVFCPDHLVRLHQVGSRPDLMAALANLPAGVTEFHVHPADDSPMLRRMAADWAGRNDDARLLQDPEFWRLITARAATLVGYQELRDAGRMITREP